jgi:hypothetical protein
MKTASSAAQGITSEIEGLIVSASISTYACPVRARSRDPLVSRLPCKSALARESIHLLFVICSQRGVFPGGQAAYSNAHQTPALKMIPMIEKNEGDFRSPDFPRPRDSDRVLFPLIEDLDHPDFVASRRQHQVDEARQLWSACAASRFRREESLSRILRERNRDGTVLVMTLNQGYSDLLLNWVHSCDRHGIEVRSWTLIVALDPDTAERFEQLGFAVYTDETSYGTQDPNAAEIFGDHTFTQMMFPKTAVVQDLLNLGFDVLFQDVDLVWKKDPAEYLLHPARKALDAQFMYDGPNDHYQPLHANSGFFYLRNTSASRKFWNLVYENFDKVFWLQSQQRVVNIVLMNRYFHGLKLDILPEQDFANGHLFQWDDVSGLPPDPYVIHCSWTSDIEHKMKKYHLAGLWYL